MLSSTLAAGAVLVMAALGAEAESVPDVAPPITRVTIFDGTAVIEHSGTAAAEFTLLISERNTLPDVLQTLQVNPAASAKGIPSTGPGVPHQVRVHVEKPNATCQVCLSYRITGVEAITQYVLETNYPKAGDTFGPPKTSVKHLVQLRNDTRYEWGTSCRLIISRTGLKTAFEKLTNPVPPERLNVHATPAVPPAVEIVACEPAQKNNHIIHRIREDEFTPVNSDPLVAKGSPVLSIAMKDAWPKTYTDPGPIRMLYNGHIVEAFAPGGATADERKAAFDKYRDLANIKVAPLPGVEPLVERTGTVTAELLTTVFGTDPSRVSYRLTTHWNYTGTREAPSVVYREPGGVIVTLIDDTPLPASDPPVNKDLLLTVTFDTRTKKAIDAQLKELKFLISKLPCPSTDSVDCLDKPVSRLRKLAAALELLSICVEFSDRVISTRRQNIFNAVTSNRPSDAAAARTDVERVGLFLQRIVQAYNKFVIQTAQSLDPEFPDAVREFSAAVRAAFSDGVPFLLPAGIYLDLLGSLSNPHVDAPAPTITASPVVPKPRAAEIRPAQPNTDAAFSVTARTGFARTPRSSSSL